MEVLRYLHAKNDGWGSQVLDLEAMVKLCLGFGGTIFHTRCPKDVICMGAHEGVLSID